MFLPRVLGGYPARKTENIPLVNNMPTSSWHSVCVTFDQGSDNLKEKHVVLVNPMISGLYLVGF